MVEKAAQGVEVRVIYDDLGSIGTYSVADRIELAQKGIKCIPFNPFLFLKSQLNNRDHRKIMVIDGKVAHSGGINLADEYINEKQPYGRWKDIGFRITGEAVNSYTYMFAKFWNAFSSDKIRKEIIFPVKEEKEPEEQEDNLSYSDSPIYKRDEKMLYKNGYILPDHDSPMYDRKTEISMNEGYILPYYDSPIYGEHVSNELFTEVLSIATNYVWFYTPYLILGDALFDAFIRAAKRGVDVRIIMPGIPDKKMVYRLSRSYYKDLLKAGVHIYEYAPGFVHAKAFVADDEIAGIGTVNLDYRSLFLHFECNSIFYKGTIIEDLKQDFLNTQSESVARTLEDVKKGALYQLGNNFLRIIAPLM